MNMKKHILIAALALSFAASANASLTKTVSGTYGPDYPELAPGNIPPASISVEQFSTSLVNDARAVLDRVVVSFNGRLQVGAYGNDGGSPAHSYTGNIYSSDPAGSSLDIRYLTTISAQSITGTPAVLATALSGAPSQVIDTGTHTYTPTTSTPALVNFDLPGLADIQLLDTILGSDLNQFLGTGNLSVGFTSSTDIAQIDGFFSSDVGIMVGTSLSVTYYYHDIPEPASLALIGLGILGAATLRRRQGSMIIRRGERQA